MKGVLALSITFLIVFVVWSVLVMVLRCCGNKYPSNNKQEVFPKARRMLFLLFGIGNIIACSIFMILAIDLFHESVKGIKGSLTALDENGYEALNLVESIEQVGQDVEQME